MMMLSWGRGGGGCSRLSRYVPPWPRCGPRPQRSRLEGAGCCRPGPWRVPDLWGKEAGEGWRRWVEAMDGMEGWGMRRTDHLRHGHGQVLHVAQALCI